MGGAIAGSVLGRVSRRSNEMASVLTSPGELKEEETEEKEGGNDDDIV